MKKFITPVLLCLLSATSVAQTEHWGCHYFQNQAPERIAYTDAQRAMINESIARSDTFDILHYDISIDVTDYNGQQIKASTTIDAVAKLPNQSIIRFDLLQLTVDSVTNNNGVMTFTHDGTFLRVDLSSSPLVGDTTQLTVHYHGNPVRDPDWGGFYFASGYIYNLGIGLSTVPPNFGKVWYPCFDSFVERATYTYHVMSSGSFRAHCQGDFLGEILLGGDTVIRSFEMTKEIPTHASAIAVADYQDSVMVHNGAFGPTTITLTAKPAAINSMVNKMNEVGQALDALEYWYGQNPFDRVGYALTTDGALEIPTNIAYPSFMVNQPVQDNRELLSHELGHHWWGDEVTPWSHEHMWLKEGPAEYSQFLTEEWIGGDDAFLDMVKDNQYRILKNAHRDDDGFHPLSPMPDAHIYGTHTYYKGASVMHNLRGYLGDMQFRSAMTDVQHMLGGRTMTPEQFRDSIQVSSGVDMDAFFDGWVFQPGYAVYVVEDLQSAQNGAVWDVDLKVRQRLYAALNYHSETPLQITLIGADRQFEDKQVMVSGQFTDLDLQTSFEPKLAIIDRYNKLNLARMRYEIAHYPGFSQTSFLPYVDARIMFDEIVDSTLINIDHIWAGADDGQLGWGVQQVSATHYWIINGVWPAGTALRGRFSYDGNNIDDLDYDMLSTNEPDVLLVHRATPQDPWEAFFDVSVTMGNPNDGVGYFITDTLFPGEYAFAVGNAIVSIEENGNGGPSASMTLYPVPAGDQLMVQGEVEQATSAEIRIFDIQGRVVFKKYAQLHGAYKHQLQLDGLDAGTYTLHLVRRDGITLAAQAFVKD